MHGIKKFKLYINKPNFLNFFGILFALTITKKKSIIKMDISLRNRKQSKYSEHSVRSAIEEFEYYDLFQKSESKEDEDDQSIFNLVLKYVLFVFGAVTLYMVSTQYVEYVKLLHENTYWFSNIKVNIFKSLNIQFVYFYYLLYSSKLNEKLA